MLERDFAREVGLEADVFVQTKEELEETYAHSRRRREKEMLEKGKILVKGKDRPWRLGTQGIIRQYTPEWPPDESNMATNLMIQFQHLIPQHSGKHRHQGGFSLFVVDGVGYTVVDGVRYNWEEGDLVLLPIKPDGCEHQHFNTGSKPARWMAMPPRFAIEAVGWGGGQRETSPLWQKFRGDYKGVVVDTKKLAHEKK